MEKKMKIVFDNDFWYDFDDEKSRVFQIFPDVYEDERGKFLESWKFIDKKDVKDDDYFEDDIHWIFKENWIKQINTSYSKKCTIRGCHAQYGPYCQAKLVSSIQGQIFDVITDMRPQSDSFMESKVFYLNPKVQNRLFVPRGFLHSFITGDEDCDYIFSYMCDNVYSKQHEIKVNPINLVSETFSKYCDKYGIKNFLNENATISDADKNGMFLTSFKSIIQTKYSYTKDNKKYWYMD